MIDEGSDRLGCLEARIGHRFSDRRFLEEALTHRSCLNESSGAGRQDNERLEFFGDAVLALFISRLLFRDYPSSREGELSQLRSALVDEVTLGLMAEELDLGSYLLLGRGEERSGGRTKRSLLADSFEALLGALYLDGGDDAVAPLVERLYSRFAANLRGAARLRDCKTEFQERSQAICGITPTYLLTGTSGPDHDRSFTVVALLGKEEMGEGRGSSKKEAEQEAARQALARLAGS
jgi:ribonuclease-3